MGISTKTHLLELSTMIHVVRSIELKHFFAIRLHIFGKKCIKRLVYLPKIYCSLHLIVLLLFQNVRLAERTLILAKNFASILLDAKALDEEPSIFQTNEMTLILERRRPDEMTRKSVGKKSTVSLPSLDVLLGAQAQNLSSVGLQVGIMINHIL